MKQPVRLLIVATLFFPITENGTISGTISYFGNQPHAVSCDQITVNLFKNIPKSNFFSGVKLVATVNATPILNSPTPVCKYTFEATTGDYILEAQDPDGFRVESKFISINPSSVTTKNLKLFPPLGKSTISDGRGNPQ